MPNCWCESRSPCTSVTAPGGVFDYSLVLDMPSQVTLRIEGKDAEEAFAHEAGGHRWQRNPPTEKRGRVHSSTLTVAVLPVPKAADVRIDPSDLDVKTTRGTGAGGQHKNKTDSAVQMKHLPTGISVFCQSERSQHQNKALALEVLRSRLAALEGQRVQGARNSKRKRQVGSGMRSDKVRTVALQRDQVVNHITGKRMKAKAYLRGNVDGLWGTS